jgi:hypothetical protein
MEGARWAIAALVFLVTLELCVRIESAMRWGAPFLGAYSHQSLFVNDSLGWHPQFGARFEKWTINSHGFRGPEIEREKAPGTVRVAVLGSSETFGQGESPEMEFPRAMERLLNQARHKARPGAVGTHISERFEVVNAGIPGMSVARMDEYWKRWVRQFDPDVVVVYPSPGFYLGNEAPPDSIPPRSGPPTVPDGGLRLPARIDLALNRFLPEGLQTELKRISVSRTRSSHEEGWVWHELPEERLDLYIRHLRRLVATLTSSGVEVVLATHASAVEAPFDQTDELLLSSEERFFPRAAKEVIVAFEGRANEEVLALGAELGVIVVPVDSIVPTDPRLFTDYQHFADSGAELAGGALADAVFQRYLATAQSGDPREVGN